MIRIASLLFLSLFIYFSGNAQFYNGLHQQFGKNRLQYREFLWTYYKFKKYDVYFYTGGRNLAVYTAKVAMPVLADLEAFLEYQLEGKIQFIIYNRLSDFKQSNIGYVSDEQSNVGGITRIAGSKVFLYFEGDHKKLEEQIRSGIAEVLVNQMMYGGNWRERVKSSTLLAMPDWYYKGLISYLSQSWNVILEDRVRDGILSKKYEKFNRLTGEDAVLAGHSVWYFISERYGYALIPTIIYMTKVSRNIESGFLFVLGSSLKSLTADWLSFYNNRFYSHDKLRELPEQKPLVKKTKSTRTYSQLKSSPDGKRIAFVTNELGQFKVWIQEIESGKRKKLLKRGHKIERINDYSFPLLAWHPKDSILTVLTEEKENMRLTYYFTDKKRKKEQKVIHNFQKILDFSYSDDGKQLVLSGVQNGQSDIFIYNIGSNTYQKITDDIYDDRYPSFINNSQQVVFSSNRSHDTLLSQNTGIESAYSKALIDHLPSYDIFLYNVSGNGEMLRRLSSTNNINEIMPYPYDSAHIAYLSDVNGMYNRYIARFDSVISHVDTIAHYRYTTSTFPITNYSRNISEHNIHKQSGKYTEILYHNGKHKLFFGDLTYNFRTMDLPNTKFREEEFEKQRVEKIDKNGETEKILSDSIILKKPSEETKSTPAKKIDIDNYIFEIEDIKPVENFPPKKEKDRAPIDATVKIEEISETEFQQRIAKQWNYNTAFSTDYFVSQLDNSYLSTAYQKFTYGSPVYNDPGINLLFKLGIIDLFENHRITGGFRISSTLTNNEYFLSYENLIRRLDKQITLHRQGMIAFSDFNKVERIHTYNVKFSMRWPFSEVLSVRGTAIFRTDRTAFQATDNITLLKENVYDYWGGIKGELVFDNTRDRGLNLFFGMRHKVFAEWYRQIDKSKTNLFVIGCDFRIYKNLHRDMIWANRLAASTSFGDNKLIYYMGGVDGWISPKFDRTTRVDPDENFTYQTLATNMRGFQQNIRNGNNFVVINSEVRLPVFRYLMNRPIRSDFSQNFQCIAFFDIGTAWTGSNPYADDNTFNTEVIPDPNIQGSPPVVITLIRQREPIIAGYGFGIRSRLWGYFIRLDYARGINDWIVQPHIWYVSLSLDF